MTCRNGLWIWLTLAALSAGTAPVSAESLLVGGNGNQGVNTGQLQSIDPTTGSGTLIPSVPSFGGFSGLAFTPAGLYATTLTGPNSVSQLQRIDLIAGTASLVGTTTINGTATRIGDLAYRSSTGLLYGLKAATDSAGLAGGIYTLDLNTGAATLLFETGITQGAVTFSTDGSILYAVTPTALLGFHPVSGAALSSVPLDFGNNNAPRSLNGLGFNHADGFLYASVGGTDDRIFQVGTDGMVQLVGNTGVGVPGDLDFQPVPEPASCALLATGVLGLAAGAWARRERRERPLGRK